MADINEENVITALAEIAFGEERCGDRLRALELLYKYLHLGERETSEGVVLIDG